MPPNQKKKASGYSLSPGEVERLRYIDMMRRLGRPLTPTPQSSTVDYYQQVLNTLGSSLIAYWPLWEAGGATAEDVTGNGYNGAYDSTVTYGITGIGDGRTGVYFDGGGDSNVNVYSAGLAAAFPTAELTVSAWFKVPSAVWTDATLRYLLSFRVDTSNRVTMERSTTNNTLILRYAASGSKTVTMSAVTSTDWMHLAITVSKANDRLRGYLNGSKVGADVTGLGVWVGALSSSYCSIGSQGGSSSPFVGSAAHVMVINRELTATEVATLSSPFDKPAIVAFGDSKTESASPGIQAFIAAMRTATGQGWHEAARLGVGGRDTPTWVSNIDAALAAIDATAAGRVRYVLYNMGANDNNDAPTYATYYADTLYCVQALHAKFPGAQIYMAKLWERGSQVWTTTVQHPVVDALALAYDYVHVGVNEVTVLEAGDDGATWTSDGTHPTSPAGYVREWTDATIGWISFVS